MSENRSTTPPAGAGKFSAADLRRRMAEREAAKAAGVPAVIRRITVSARWSVDTAVSEVTVFWNSKRPW